MENPNTWKRAEHVIMETWLKWEENMAAPPEKTLFGPSLPRMIADALRKEGLLDDSQVRPEDW